MSKPVGFNVENPEDLITLLNSLNSTVRSQAVLDGMIAGANMINNESRARLSGMAKSKSSYFSTSFKMEALKGRTPDEIGIRTGVYNKQKGYLLRWLEFGTTKRVTLKRKNPTSKEITPPMNRGQMTAYSYFFGVVKNNQEETFRIVSETIIKSLEDMTAKS